MDPNPAEVNGVRQRLFVLVRDESTRMPACASVEHVEDDVLVDEQEITLDLLVEGVKDIPVSYTHLTLPTKA